ncbi:hypothetical protein AVEN_226250-1 [Araneus ventricosus]|uniref:Peptidase aspartic putative domain-containing protein n=1 Tax=Araneus ventricosus TaxID=182803 RepID=A0A4Y2MSW4_ARAVE|nr:hypothetical protein AVEN_226250-1 [Araneus ventricosus]
MVKKCKSTSSCKNCQKRRNALLHIDRNLRIQNQRLSPQAEVFVPSSEITTSNMVLSNSVCTNNLVKEKENTNVLLCTAVANLLNSKNQFVSARCILDSASQKSYIKAEEHIQFFWELEQIPTSSSFTKEKSFREKHFTENYARNDKGRYSVKLSFKAERQELGDSKRLSFRQFLNLEKRLLKMSNVYQQYKDFMSEYLSLGHIEEENENSVYVKNEHFYIPHHHVIKESSLTSRLRVVFNASAKSSSGVSLNDWSQGSG